jgi:hypothetical protein
MSSHLAVLASLAPVVSVVSIGAKAAAAACRNSVNVSVPDRCDLGILN